jgi:predicted MFS family arabinose efflux permease
LAEDDGETELSPWSLRLFFLFIICVNILVNIDHGCIPACTLTLKADLKIDNAALGMLGSVVYFGLLIGSFVAPPTFHHLPAKLIILICMLANAASLLLFTLTMKFFWLCVFRFSVGFFQVFLCIYFPVWVDVFAHEKSKTIWLTILQASVPLGIVIGYCLTAVLDAKWTWRISYYIQTGLYVVMFFLLIIIKRNIIEEDHEDDEEDEDED